MTKTPSVERSTVCPWCRAENDRVSNCHHDQPTTPQNGDVSVCIECGAPSIFDDVPGGLRAPNEAERAKMAADHDVQETLQAWRSVFRSEAQ